MITGFSRYCSAIILTGLFLDCCSPGQGPETSLLEAGAAKAVITPVVETFEDLNGNNIRDEGEPFSDLNRDGRFNPVWIAGFGAKRQALGIHDNLYARALVLVQGRVRIGIVAVDWVGLLRDQVLDIGLRARRAGVALDKLIITCTHNHEGPDSIGLWGPFGKTGRDDGYMEWAGGQIVSALLKARDRLSPVHLAAGTGKTENLTNDSRLPIVIHEELVALRFDRVDGSGPVAVVTHWSNHVEALGGSNHLISADFPASLVSTLEEAYPGAVGIYWQGMVGGLMTPLGVEVKDDNGKVLEENSFAKADRLGRLVADVALSALDRGEYIDGSRALTYRDSSFFVPLENEDFKIGALMGLFERKVYDDQGNERSSSDIMKFQPYLETEADVIDVGGVQIVTVPGELYPELALEGPSGETYYQEPQDPGADFFPCDCSTPIYHNMRETPYRIVLGLANDELGYIIPRCQFDREPPYAYERDTPQYGEDFSVGPQAAPLLNHELARELDASAARQE
ncbi:MAG: hypothetical protein GXP49_09135 [Deltaproteobacteria bacterium]|nr:hypothetical protein [Deltaproteobacteria bacterium]